MKKCMKKNKIKIKKTQLSVGVSWYNCTKYSKAFIMYVVITDQR